MTIIVAGFTLAGFTIACFTVACVTVACLAVMARGPAAASRRAPVSDTHPGATSGRLIGSMDETITDHSQLRRGRTTGACAAATAKAGFAAGIAGELPAPLTMRLPRGHEAAIRFGRIGAGDRPGMDRLPLRRKRHC
jgi:hypothetical protein